jgi:type IV pilus assembly protein PilB
LITWKPIITHRTLADILIAQRPVPAEDLDAVVAEALETGVRIELVLRRRGLVSGEDMAAATAEYLGMPLIGLSGFTPDQNLVHDMPAPVLRDLKILPLARWGDVLAVAPADPFDAVGIENAENLTGLSLLPYVAPEEQVFSLMAKYQEESGASLEDVMREVPTEEPDIEVGMADEQEISLDEMLDLSSEAPVVRVTNSILAEALHNRASDIHIEPMEKRLLVRYRIDGVLYDKPSPPKHMQWAIISRIKILSNMDVAERRLPQDGRLTVRSEQREADVRVSMIPTVHGQKAVLRILDKSNLSPNVAALHLESDAYEKIMYAVRQPHGMILVTGPTGSGKTTTLYAALNELNTPDTKLLTAEDPVEYDIEGLVQCQVNHDQELTFAKLLRSFLRQDPDIILVGEVRDLETAQIAIQASLTGHLVFTTLHTNDAPSSIARLLDLGVEGFLLTATLEAIVAQRLARRICTQCKEEFLPSEEQLMELGLRASEVGGRTFYRGKGCERCNRSGYKGRLAVFEIMVMNDDMRELIMQQASTAVLRHEARKRGMRTLRECGMLSIYDGQTTIDEIVRETLGED